MAGVHPRQRNVHRQCPILKCGEKTTNGRHQLEIAGLFIPGLIYVLPDSVRDTDIYRGSPSPHINSTSLGFELPAHRHNRQAFDPGLGYQQAIEGIPMLRRQGCDVQDMDMLNRQGWNRITRQPGRNEFFRMLGQVRI